jgi:hypothetical protein
MAVLKRGGFTVLPLGLKRQTKFLQEKTCKIS